MNETIFMLSGIIALLVVIIGVLLWRFLHSQNQIEMKNDTIIREIRENVELRSELQRRICVK